MNFCGECGKDLRIAHKERFCEICGREFQGPNILRSVPSASTALVNSSSTYTGLRELALELGRIYSFTSSPATVANQYFTPPVEVEEDSNFETFNEGSLDTEMRYVSFEHPTQWNDELTLTFKFVNKTYSFYRSGDMNVFGLEAIFIQHRQELSREGLIEAFGTPTESSILDNFDRADRWDLPTPTGGKKGKESFVAYYKAVSPHVTTSFWMNFPEN